MNKLLTTMFALAVASVTAVSQAQEIKGDAAAGQSKASMCIGCHGIVGYRASFPEVYSVPAISGQSASYIATALNAYKTAERKHPTMRAIADPLNEQDIADLAAFYSTHMGRGDEKTVAAEPSKAPNSQVAALINRDAANSCVQCHGANFSTPRDATVPKIGGQHRDYLFAALKAYKVDNNPAVGRSNGIMAGIAKKYTNAELRDLSNYIGSLDGELKVVPEPRFR